jgi:hypothetical protein
MPSLEPINPTSIVVEALLLPEREKIRVSSITAQMDIVLCFRNDEEPPFQLLSPVIYSIPNL